MSRTRKAIIIYVLLVLAFTAMALFYTRPLALKADDHTMRENAGDTMFHIYVLSWTAHALKTNPFNLFNATIFYPNRYTLAYSDHELMSSLIALPVLALSRNGVLAFNFVIIVSFVLSALGAYLLVWHLTRDRYAGFAGAIIFGFPLYKLAHISHLQLVSTGFLPLALLCLHLYTEKRQARYLVGFGAFTVALFWTVWSYGFFLAFAVLVYLAVLAIVERDRLVRFFRRRAPMWERRAMVRWMGMLVVAFIGIGLVLFPFIRPYLEAGKLNPNFQRDIAEVYSYSGDVEDFAVAPPESLVWGAATGLVRPDPYLRGNGAERSLFPGLAGLLLAVAGVYYLSRLGASRRFVLWFYVVLLLVAGMMCLGVTLYAFGRHADLYMPYRLLYKFFPGFKAVRTPTRMFVLVILSISVLAGFGVRWVRDRLSARLDRVAVSALLVILLALTFAELLPTGIEMKPMQTRGEFPGVYRWLASRSGPAPTVVLPVAPYDAESQSGMDDLAFVGMEPQRTYYNTANWKELLNGYSGYAPVSYKQAVKDLRDFPSRSSLRFLKGLGIQYVVLEEARYERRRFADLLAGVRGTPELRQEYASSGYYAFSLR